MLSHCHLEEAVSLLHQNLVKFMFFLPVCCSGRGRKWGDCDRIRGRRSQLLKCTQKKKKKVKYTVYPTAHWSCQHLGLGLSAKENCIILPWTERCMNSKAHVKQTHTVKNAACRKVINLHNSAYSHIFISSKLSPHHPAPAFSFKNLKPRVCQWKSRAFTKDCPVDAQKQNAFKQE